MNSKKSLARGSQSKLSHRWQQGLRAHDLVKQVLERQGKYELLCERWRPPLPITEGMGELDLVYRSAGTGAGLVIEVKSVQLALNQSQSIGCLGPVQIQRIWKSMRYLRLEHRFSSLRFFLALADLSQGKVEFLENPC